MIFKRAVDINYMSIAVNYDWRVSLEGKNIINCVKSIYFSWTSTFPYLTKSAQLFFHSLLSLVITILLLFSCHPSPVHPSFFRSTSARVLIYIHTHHSYRYSTFIPPLSVVVPIVSKTLILITLFLITLL
jgi:hypothetical protein